MCVLILDTFNGCSSSIKEKCQSFTIQKNWGSQNVDFLEDEIWKNFKEQTSTWYIRGNVIGIIVFSCLSSTDLLVSIQVSRSSDSDFFQAWCNNIYSADAFTWRTYLVRFTCNTDIILLWLHQVLISTTDINSVHSLPSS